MPFDKGQRPERYLFSLLDIEFILISARGRKVRAATAPCTKR